MPHDGKTGWFPTGGGPTLQKQVALIAQPLRALLDRVYLHKLPWQGLDGLRIDEQKLRAITRPELTQLLNVYNGKREREFIEALLRSLGL